MPRMSYVGKLDIKYIFLFIFFQKIGTDIMPKMICTINLVVWKILPCEKSMEGDIMLHAGKRGLDQSCVFV